MADSIQLRRGAKASLPTLADGEPGWCKDTKELYIGSVKVADEAVFGQITSLQNRASNLENEIGKKLTASKAASQVDLSSTADLAAVISAYNGLLAALREAGIMTT